MVQVTSQIRKVAQEVSKAVNEQGRAARDIIKAAQATSAGWPGAQGGAGAGEAAAQIAQSADSMRAGRVSRRARSASRLDGRADWQSRCRRVQPADRRSDRASASRTAAARRSPPTWTTSAARPEQAGRALADQARAMKELPAASQNTSKQIKLISAANREHATVPAGLLDAVAGDPSSDGPERVYRDESRGADRHARAGGR